jgi:hypothetical protein
MFNLTRRNLLQRTLPALLLIPFVARRATAQEFQPHMREALDALHLAERELSQATHDKGGHRAKALRLVRDAIREAEAGVRFDNRH